MRTLSFKPSFNSGIPLRKDFICVHKVKFADKHTIKRGKTEARNVHLQNATYILTLTTPIISLRNTFPLLATNKCSFSMTSKNISFFLCLIPSPRQLTAFVTWKITRRRQQSNKNGETSFKARLFYSSLDPPRHTCEGGA